MVPWKLLTSGSGFITFLGSYNIFISPICGIIIVDYFVLKRGNIHTPSLFDPQKGSLYYYQKGWNLKALAAWVSGAVFGIPGLVGSYHPTWVSEAGVHIYQTGWIVCICVAMSLYFGMSLVVKPEVFPKSCEVKEKRWEGLAETEGYLDGDDKRLGVMRLDGRDPRDGEVEAEDSVRSSMRTVELSEKFDGKN